MSGQSSIDFVPQYQDSTHIPRLETDHREICHNREKAFEENEGARVPASVILQSPPGCVRFQRSQNRRQRPCRSRRCNRSDRTEHSLRSLVDQVQRPFVCSAA